MQQHSDLEGTGDQPQIMRIASQGAPNMNHVSSEKKQTRSSDPGNLRVEFNSVEGDRSLDPDHEPRKEGTVKNMKHSPSVVEIGGMDAGLQSDGNSLVGDERSFRKGSQSKSPVQGARIHGLHGHITESDDDYASRGGNSLTRDNKHTRSNRKIKPMYNHNLGVAGNQGSKAMLKVVHEDEPGPSSDNHIGYLNKGGNGLSSLMSIVSTNSGGQQNQ